MHAGSLVAILTVVSFLFTLAELRAECPDYPTQIAEGEVSAEGKSATIGIDRCGRFVVGYQEEMPAVTDNRRDVLVRQYTVDGTALTDAQLLSADNQQSQIHKIHERPSLAMSAEGLVRVGWLGDNGDWQPAIGPLVQMLDFPYGSEPARLPLPGGPEFLDHHEPSVGVSDWYGGAVAWAATWEWDPQSPEGLKFGPSTASPTLIRSCGAACYTDKWLPCVAVRPSDGYRAIAYAYDEEPLLNDPKTNIALRIYTPMGVLVAQLDGPDINDPSQWVNDPSLEDPNEQLNTEQVSPAVSFDDAGNVVCTWVGPGPAGCSSGPHVYARRFKFNGTVLRDPDPAQGEGRAGIFIVNSGYQNIDPDGGHPTVALKLHPGRIDLGGDFGSFIVAWNIYTAPGYEIRGQYFNNIGEPIGGEVRLNQADGADGYARIAKSGQHTVVYGPDHQIALSWTQGRENASGQKGVYFTLLPESYRFNGQPACCESESECRPCMKGDVNVDCEVNGLVFSRLSTCCWTTSLCAATSWRFARRT